MTPSPITAHRRLKSSLALAATLLASLVSFASPAGAQAAPHYIETSHEVECGAIEITLRNVSPWIYPVSVEIDGVHSWGPTVDNRTDTDGDGEPNLNGPQKDQSVTRRITFEEGQHGGEILVRYRVAAGSENDLYVGLPVGEWTEVLVNTNCNFELCPAVGNVHATNLNTNGWRVTGPVDYLSDGLEMNVPGGWVSTSITRDVNLPISKLGTLDFVASPSQYFGIHMRLAGGGSLVYEQELSYGGQWWLSSSAPDRLKTIVNGPGAGGSAWHAAPEVWLQTFPDLVIESVTLLYTHSGASQTKLTSATFGCTTYTFGRESVPPVTPAPGTPPTTPTIPTDSTTTTTTESTTTTEPADVGGITEDPSDPSGAEVGAVDAAAAGAGQLPRTGAGVGAMLLTAVLLLGLGATFRIAAGRRSA